tara:strand:- start:179 stop:385 length:207 start_codon:yes stop_codon:yes gene_type:complete
MRFILPDIGLMVHMLLLFLASTDSKLESTGFSSRFAIAQTINEKPEISYNLGTCWTVESPEVAYIYKF